MSGTRFLDQNRAFTIWSEGSFGVRQSWQETWSAYVRQDKYMRDAILCIALVFGGDRFVYVSTRPHRARSGQTGRTYTYLPMLQEEPEIVAEYSLGGGQASQRSFAMSLDARLIKPAEIIGEGRMLAGFAEVSLQFPGIDHDRRFVIMRGDMSGGVRFASDRELLDFEIVDPVNTQEYYVPTTTATTDRHSTLPDESNGQRYPLCLTSHPYVPALRLDGSTTSPDFLVVGGADHSVPSGQVYRNGQTATGPTWPNTTGVQYDALGSSYLEVDFSGGTGTWEDGDTVYAGVVRADGADLLLIDVILRLVRFHTLMGLAGVNQRLFGVAESRVPGLNPRVLINGSGSGDSATAFSYIESTLCAEYPMVTMVWTCGGYGPVVTDRRSGLHVAEWTARKYPLTTRATSVEESPKSEVYNVFSMRFGYNPMLDEYEGYVYRDASNSVLCALSQEHVGRREMDVIEAVTVYDSADANYIVDWLAAHNAMPSYYVEYDAAPTVMVEYQLGDNVKLSDPELGWSGVTATIERLVYRRGYVTVGLRCWVLYPDLPGGGVSGQVYAVTT